MMSESDKKQEASTSVQEIGASSTDVYPGPIAVGFGDTQPLTKEYSPGNNSPSILTTDNFVTGDLENNSTTLVYSKDVRDPHAIRGRCGLYNLGNTCFLNSGLQCLMSSLPLVRFLLDHPQTDHSIDHTLLGQFQRVFAKIWGGQYSVIYPRDFKQTLGLYHPQFQDYRQHDCQEFLALLLDTLHEHLNFKNHGATNPFAGAGSSSQKQPIDFELNINNRSLTSLVSEKRENINMDQSNNVVTNKTVDQSHSHSTLTFDNIKGSLHDNSISSSSQSVIEKDENRSNLVTFNPTVISEDSNHSVSSTNSSDSEQCSVIKNLKLRSSPVISQSGTSSPKTSQSETSFSQFVNIGTKDCNISASDDACAKIDSSQQVLEHKLNLVFDSRVEPGLLKSDTDYQQDSVHLKRTATSKRSQTEMMDFQQTMEVSSSVPHVKNNSLSEMDVSIVQSSSADRDMDSDSDAPVLLNNAVSATSVPSLEDLYAKETKTLNTNVLSTEYMQDTVAMDSDKFMKHDNTSESRPELLEESEILSNVFHVEGAGKKDDDVAQQKIKDVNLHSNKKSRVSNGACGSTVVINNTEDCFAVERVKRMKFEGTEKNLQMQELSKINKQKILFGELRPSINVTQNVDVESDSEVEDRDNDMDLSDDDDDGNAVAMQAEGGDYAVSDVVAAEKAWQTYQRKNDSIIVNTFQGQFKSTVICSECNQVSVTFEPFMYLSVPVPHAMERQICVTFICPGALPTQHCLLMHKHDKVVKVKQELCNLIGRQDCDIIMAEVLNWHVSRILEDNTMLRYVNDTSRQIYAFELDPQTVKSETTDDSTHRCQDTGVSSSVEPEKPDTTSTDDIFSHMDSFTGNSSQLNSQYSNGSQQYSNGSQQYSLGSQQYSTGSHSQGFDSPTLASQTVFDLQAEQPIAVHTTTDDQSDFASDPKNYDLMGTALWEWAERGNINGEAEDGEHWPPMADSTSPTADDPKVKVTEGGVSSSTPAETEWKSCAICLEELTDSELMVHTSCGGTFCPTCLEMSVQHYGDSSYCCPVCSTPAVVTEDFVPLASAASHKPKNRVVTVPIGYRCETDILGENSPFIFGHPAIMNLPSNLTGEHVYRCIDKITPVQAEYRILLTDGQGLRCSRCLYMEHCLGCEIPRHGEVVLRPADHLTVSIQAVSLDQVSLSQEVQGHKSMEKQRPNEPVSLIDCFSAFTQSEDLDEHNPWFCPNCQRHQRAVKTMTVWQYPDTLIIHLKRFVFHDLSSSKVDNKVAFPVDDLDLSNFISGPKTKLLQYNLYSIVCHFGGANSGHYTAYAKHPVDGQWYYYNDETVSLQTPGEDDYSSTYVLFFQRRGTDVALQIPDDLDLSDKDTDEESSHVTSGQGSSTLVYNPPDVEIIVEKTKVAGVEMAAGQIEDDISDNRLDFYS